MPGAVKDPKGWIPVRAEPTRMSVPTMSAVSLSVRSSSGTLGSLFGQRLDFKTQESVDSPYSQSGWVHACLKPGGQAIAQLPGQLWDSEPETNENAKRIEPGQHELADLFVEPNAHQTPSQFFEAGFLHRRLDGADYWLQLGPKDKPIERPGEIPTRLVPVRGKAVSYRTDERGWPVEYRISFVGGLSEVVPAHALTAFRDYDPDNPFGGLADIDVALPDIDLEWQAYRYQRGIIENAGDPGGWIEGLENLAPDERQAVETELEEEFKVVNAGRVRGLRKGYKYTPNKLSPRDMEFRLLLQWIRDKIASITGVPLPIIGVLDRATFSNYEQAVELFWKGGNGVLSYVRSVEDVVTNQFLRRLSDARAKKFVFRFDTSRVEALREDKNAQLELAGKLVSLGIGISKKEAFKRVGLEVDDKDVEFGDVRLVRQGMTTIEATIEVAENPPEPEPDPAVGAPKDPPKEEPAKAAEPEHREPEIVQADAAYEERSAYWHAKEAAYLGSARAKVASKYKGWRQKYEAAQLKRLQDIAEGKAAAVSLRAMDDDGKLDPARIEPQDVEPLLLSMDEWRKKMDAAMRKTIAEIFRTALADVADELNVDMVSPTDGRVLSFLEEQVIQLTGGHAEVLAERVREVLLEGLSKATNIGTLQQLVAEVLPELEGDLKESFSDKQARALTIARTETAHAANGARFMQMKDADVEEHEWITSRDENVRGDPSGPYADAEFSHAALEGVTAKIGEEFTGSDGVTHKGLTHPSDPDADPADSINCRCIARAVRKPASEDDEL